MADEKPEETKEPVSRELTPEQKAKINAVSITVAKFNKMVPPFLFNQLQMIEEGEIHIHLTVRGGDIERMELSSHLARDLSKKEPEGAEKG